MSRPALPAFAFTRAERDIIRRHRTPRSVQRWLRGLPYNKEERGETLRSFRGVVRHGIVHCLEAALCAATVLKAEAVVEHPLCQNLAFNQRSQAKYLLHHAFPGDILWTPDLWQLGIKESHIWEAVLQIQRHGLVSLTGDSVCGIAASRSASSCSTCYSGWRSISPANTGSLIPAGPVRRRWVGR